MTSVMRYIFYHFDDYKICHDFGLDIERLVCKAVKAGSVKTLFELYEEIAKQQPDRPAAS